MRLTIEMPIAAFEQPALSASEPVGVQLAPPVDGTEDTQYRTREATGDVRIAGARIHGVWLTGIDRQCADRHRPFERTVLQRTHESRVGERYPRSAAPARLPHTALGRAEIDDVRVARIDGERIRLAADYVMVRDLQPEWADRDPALTACGR